MSPTRADDRIKGGFAVSPRSVTLTIQPAGEDEVSPPTMATPCSPARVKAAS
jgi:hypothetical protein